MMLIKKIYKFYNEVRQEVAKIFWPTRSEVISSSAMVLIVVFIFSIFFLLLDYGIYHFVHFLLNIGK
jgi:preprotein translocase subunit SecE